MGLRVGLRVGEPPTRGNSGAGPRYQRRLWRSRLVPSRESVGYSRRLPGGLVGAPVGQRGDDVEHAVFRCTYHDLPFLALFTVSMSLATFLGPDP